MTTVTISPSVSQADVMLANKYLVDEALWTRLTERIVKDDDVDLPLAERIMDQALGFLKLCAENPGGSYGPAPLPDVGWHTFILYTREYAAFCDRIAGRFIHHAPSDQAGVDYSGTGGVRHTVDAMRASGITVDEALWVTTRVSCGNDDCSNPCHKVVETKSDCGAICTGTCND